MSVLLIYADAPPHHPRAPSDNCTAEYEALKEKADWVTLSRAFRDKGVSVHAIINSQDHSVASFFVFLSEVTGGHTFHLNNTTVP